MKRLTVATISAALFAISFVTAPAAVADVCKSWTSNWNVYEGSMPFKTGSIHTTHRVCVTNTGYTFRFASSDFSETNAAHLAGFVYKMSPMRPYQTDGTFDGWLARGKYQVCIWQYGVQACPPGWGTFVVKHRVARFTNTTTLVKVNDFAKGTNVWGDNFKVRRP